MSAGLPSMVYGDGISKKQQVQFGGYNHNLGAADGEIWDMQNLTSDYYPLLAPRKARQYIWKNKEMKNCDIFYAGGMDGERHLYMTEADKLYRVEDGGALTEIANLTKKEEDVQRVFSSLGQYVVILPDKVAFNTKTEEIEKLEASWTGDATLLEKGSYMGEEAEANTIYAEGANWDSLFREGDAVEIEGWSIAENNKTIIIREINGDYLRFYENSFIVPEDGWEEGGIMISRKAPDMDFICENENRLWGCKGNTIYASKLGDPFNWNVFDGVATDSFTTDVNTAGSYFATGVGSAGDFTGCISYLGYPCFFKEDHIYKVYGDRPANFQVMGSASLGVAKGSGKSLAVAGETLFYLSRIGIVAYTGGIPQSVAAPFGDVKYINAVAGSDGVKYYVYMQRADNPLFGGCLFVYDTRKGLWHKEDRCGAHMFAYEGSVLTVLCGFDIVETDSEGGYVTTGRERDLWQYGGEPGEETISSFAEFGDFVESDPNRKGLSKLQLRVELSEGATFKVYIQFDSDGEWRLVKELKADRKKSFYLPIIPRRCDHYRIKLEGVGDWKVHSMVRETYSGSEI